MGIQQTALTQSNDFQQRQLQLQQYQWRSFSLHLKLRSTIIQQNTITLLLLLTRRLSWRLVQKLQGHVTHKKDDMFGRQRNYERWTHTGKWKI